jgi:2-hydroxy-3-keto-5-methylthiopentenyl-1-phosphate phosphatase
MSFPESVLSQPRVLVSDFDGTMTEHDFYLLAIKRLIPRDTPNFWDEYRTGTITHFEGLRRYFAAIPEPEAAVRKVVADMGLDSRLKDAVGLLRDAGWAVVITSAGCDWYIRQLLNDAGVEIPVFANPGQFVEGQGLVMTLPTTSPFFSQNLGIDKQAIVKSLVAMGKTVAYAGDGLPDADPARLVADPLRFARGDLADVLAKEGLPFHSYSRWFDIAACLSQEAQS